MLAHYSNCPSDMFHLDARKQNVSPSRCRHVAFFFAVKVDVFPSETGSKIDFDLKFLADYATGNRIGDPPHPRLI